MKGKKSFVAYCDWGELFDNLEDQEAGRLVKHLFDYVRDKDPEAPDQLTKMMFITIQQQLKRDLDHWEEVKQIRSLNGSKGGRPKAKKANGLLEKQTKAKKAVNDNVNVNVTVNDNVINKNKRFTPPTLSEVYDYMVEKGMSETEAQTQSSKFINYYDSNGWKVGKNKMQKWRSAVSGNWLKDISSNGKSIYTYEEVQNIHFNPRDKKTMKDFKVIEGTTNWISA